MKKLIYSVFIVATVGIFFAFTQANAESKKDEPFCIEIECKKDPKCDNGCVWFKYKEVVYAFNASQARQIAVSKHPGCRVGNAFKGTCK